MQQTKGLRRKIRQHELKAKFLEGNPVVVAMDLAKKRHAVWVTDRTRVPIARFTVEHSAAGIQELDERVQAIKTERGYDRAVFFMEPTAHFWKNVAHGLEKRGRPYRLIPGLATSRQREISTSTFAKSDYKDSEMISALGLSLHFFSRQLEPAGRWTEMAYLAAEYQDVTELAAREKIRIRSFLDLLFPEYLSLVGEAFYATKCSLAILSNLREAGPSAPPPWETFLERVRTSFRGKTLRIRTVRKVYEALARGSDYGVAPLWSAASWRVMQAAQRLLGLQDQLDRTREELLRRYRELPYAALLDTIRGVSEMQAALTLALMGDPVQYDDSSCVTKLAGLEPGENESGDSHGKTPVTHRGRGRLRLAATRTAFTLLLVNVDFQEYQLRLMARNKNPLSYMQAFVACANKYLRMVYMMCRTGQPYRSDLVRPTGNNSPMTELGVQVDRLGRRSQRLSLKDKLRKMREVLQSEQGQEVD